MGNNREIMFRAIYDNIGRAMITENENDVLYEEALEAVKNYITDPSLELKEATALMLCDIKDKIKTAPIFDNLLGDEHFEFMMQE